MDASPVKFVDYFSKEIQYLIPLFQRPYVWKEEQWDTLWKDVLSYYEDEEPSSDQTPHFMGAIVSTKVKTVPVGVDKYLIIDGQQRLTTFTLLLSAIRDSVKEGKIPDKIQGLLVNLYQEKTPDYLKLMPTQADRNVYFKIICREIEALETEKSTHKIFKCYKYFIKLLAGKEEDQNIEPEKILKILEKRFQVVMINLTESDDPYLIFESLNFKGEKLTQTDLIRNLILMKFQHSSDEGGVQKKIYDEFWSPLEEMLGEQIEDFFFHYVRMANAVKSVKTHIYSDMKLLLQKSPIEESLSKIEKCARDYDRFLNPQKEEDLGIRKELLFLNRTRCVVVYPFLLKLNQFRNCGLDNDTYLRCLRILNSIIIRKLICQKQTNSLNTIVAGLLNGFNNYHGPLSSLDLWLTENLLQQSKQARWPDDTDFVHSIVSRIDWDKKIQILFLESIENFLAKKEVVDLSNMTLEHIMPQTLSTQWIEELGENYEQIHSKYLWNIGNLTLTGYNSEYSNRTFNEKKTMENGFAASGLKMNLEIAKFEKWGEAEILQRANALAEIAVQIWKYPVNTPKTKLNLNNVWTSKVVQCLVINGRRVPVASWRESAKTILNYFQKENPETFSKRLSAGELPKVQYVPLEQNDGCAFEVKLDCSAEDIRKAILKWCSLMKCDTSLFIFEVINA